MNGDRQACVERLVPPVHTQQTVQHEPSRASEQADDEALVQDAAPDGDRNEAADGVPHWRAADPLVQRAAPAAFAPEKEQAEASPDQTGDRAGRSWQRKR